MSHAAASLREAVIRRVLEGNGTTSPEARRNAFENKNVDERARALVDKVARHAWKVTDADVRAAVAAGVDEDAVFELTVAAALGQSSRQLEAALAALDAAVTPGQPDARRDRQDERGPACD